MSTARTHWRLLLLSIGAAVLLGYAVWLSRDNGTAHPPSSATPDNSSELSMPDGPIPRSIDTHVRRGQLIVDLTVAPVNIGPAQFRASVFEGNRPITGATVSMRLSMPSQPSLGLSVLATKRCSGGFCAQGTLQALGRWRVEVTVRQPDAMATVQNVPFDLLNGANARFLFSQPPNTQFGPATVRLTRVGDGSSLLRIQLHRNLKVRGVVLMPNMQSMGSANYPFEASANDWYSASLAFPMTGVEQLTVQARVRQEWKTVRTLLYDVDSEGNATLLTNTAS